MAFVERTHHQRMSNIRIETQRRIQSREIEVVLRAYGAHFMAVVSEADIAASPVDNNPIIKALFDLADQAGVDHSEILSSSILAGLAGLRDPYNQGLAIGERKPGLEPDPEPIDLNAPWWVRLAQSVVNRHWHGTKQSIPRAVIRGE